MENRVVALAVLENLLHWPLPHRSGYVAAAAAASSTDESGGEEDGVRNTAPITAGDADDLLREPRQRKLDRCRAVLLLPHLCHKLGSRWVESEVVPYLLRCLEEDDAQLSLVTGLALLGVAMPRRSPLGGPVNTATASAAAVTAATAGADEKAAGLDAARSGGAASPSPTSAAPPSPASSSDAAPIVFLSLEDVQPVCALLAASGTEETRAFAAQVVLPHLFFGMSLERDVTLESWDVKYVPLSVLHADLVVTGSGGAGGGDDAAAAEEEDGAGEDGGSRLNAATDVSGDGAAMMQFVTAVRRQMLLARRQQQQQLQRSREEERTKGDKDPAAAGGVVSDATRVAASSASPRPRGQAAVVLSEEEVQQRCEALASQDEAMQFLFSGAYDSLSGPWGFSGCRLASLAHGSKALLPLPSPGSDSSDNKTRGSGQAFVSAGGGFRSFRSHTRRVSGGGGIQRLRGVPPPSQRPLAGADLGLVGATYAMDRGSNNDSGSHSGTSSAAAAGSSVAVARDDFFSVNVRARALVADLTTWMEAIAPAKKTASPLLLSAGCVTVYDYLAHDGRREALRSRWHAQLKLLQSLLESPYPGAVATAVDLVAGLLHALQFLFCEVEDYSQAHASNDGGTAGEKRTVEEAAAMESGVGLRWGIAAPAAPLLTTAQLQHFIFVMTRRHIAYCVVAAVSTRKVSVPPAYMMKTPTPTGDATAAAAAALRAPTEALVQLMRAALSTAQKTLTDLLVRYRLLVQIRAPPPPVTMASSKKGQEKGEGEGKAVLTLLQLGGGPCEARAAALAAWDISFTPSASSSHASPFSASTPRTSDESMTMMVVPDDTATLLRRSSVPEKEVAGSVAGDAEKGEGAAQRADEQDEATTTTAAAQGCLRWVPGTLNAFSMFRVHRIVRRALLRALPILVDFSASPLANRDGSSTLASSSGGGGKGPGSAATSPTSAAAPGTLIASSPSSTSSTTTTSRLFSLSSVCPLLLQMLVPPAALPALLNVLSVAATLPSSDVGLSAPGSKERHADAALLTTTMAAGAAATTLESVVPELWAAMTAPGSVLSAAEGAATGASAQGQETPSSLDFALLEAALDSVQRLMAEAAVQISTRPGLFAVAPSRREGTSTADAAALAAHRQRALHAVCAPLFTLLAACVRWVPRYTSWKARWLIAQRLSQLVAAFAFLLARMAEADTRNQSTMKQTTSDGKKGKTVAGGEGSWGGSAAADVALQWLSCTLQLLTSVWSCAEAFGVAPLNDLTDDEEVEVRCIAVHCSAAVFRRVTEAVLRISASISSSSSSSASSAAATNARPAGKPQAAATSPTSSPSTPTLLLLPTLREPLTQLLDATAQCVLVGANDVDARVRCRSVEALAVLSRTLSLLVAADGTQISSSTHTNNNNSSSRSGSGAGGGPRGSPAAEPSEAVWARYLRSNTDALLRLMSDEKPTVQLALVSQLTDLLLMQLRHASSSTKTKSSDKETYNSSSGGGSGERGADQVQYDALLSCLRQLSQHELWRLREQYAILLAHLCGRLLQAALIAPRKTTGGGPHGTTTTAAAGGGGGRRGGTGSPSPSAAGTTANTTRGRTNASPSDDDEDEESGGAMQADLSPYSHTHPLYQLARTELLALLVAVLFDKVKAVRDTALDAVEKMCLQLAAANRQSATSLSQQESGGLAGAAQRGDGSSGGGSGVGSLGARHRNNSSNDGDGGGAAAYNFNTFVDDILWPRIAAYDRAWETYLSRSALLHIALRLRVDKTSIFIPLLDQLARDPVLNVRLVVAKIILTVLLRSSADVYAATVQPLAPTANRDGEDEGDTATAASLKPELPAGTVAYCVLMNKPTHPLLAGGGYANSRLNAALPPLTFDEAERTGVVLQMLRQLLKDASADVRDEAAKALKVCF